MRFPLLNISESKWNDDDLMEYLRDDKYFYSDNQAYFDKYLNGKLFCDCNGEIFKVTDKIPPVEWWRKAFKFLPNVYKEEVVFKCTGDKIELNDLRKYLLGRINDLSENEFQKKWISHINYAKTYEELINGEIK